MRVDFSQLMRAHQLAKAHPPIARPMLQLVHNYIGLLHDLTDAVSELVDELAQGYGSPQGKAASVKGLSAALFACREALARGHDLPIEPVEPSPELDAQVQPEEADDSSTQD